MLTEAELARAGNSLRRLPDNKRAGLLAQLEARKAGAPSYDARAYRYVEAVLQGWKPEPTQRSPRRNGPCVITHGPSL